MNPLVYKDATCLTLIVTICLNRQPKAATCTAITKLLGTVPSKTLPPTLSLISLFLYKNHATHSL